MVLLLLLHLLHLLLLPLLMRRSGGLGLRLGHGGEIRVYQVPVHSNARAPTCSEKRLRLQLSSYVVRFFFRGGDQKRGRGFAREAGAFACRAKSGRRKSSQRPGGGRCRTTPPS